MLFIHLSPCDLREGSGIQDQAFKNLSSGKMHKEKNEKKGKTPRGNKVGYILCCQTPNSSIKITKLAKFLQLTDS